MDKQAREWALNKMREKAKTRGEDCSRYAAGGSAKVREGVATKSGKVVKPRKNMGRSGK
jgi:hypothetical protein